MRRRGFDYYVGLRRQRARLALLALTLWAVLSGAAVGVAVALVQALP